MVRGSEREERAITEERSKGRNRFSLLYSRDHRALTSFEVAKIQEVIFYFWGKRTI